MRLSDQQSLALAECATWLDDPSRQVFALFGYAGTGKTTIASRLVERAGGEWLFGAFTGKAAHVLRRKGCEGARTLHSILYRPAGETSLDLVRIRSRRLELEAASDRTTEEDHELRRLIREEARVSASPRFAAWDGSPLADLRVSGIVVDEVSMVGERLGRDLEGHGKKILVLGDPAQLPPVGSGGYFTDREPDVLLTEVHRQARDSGVLDLATHVRCGGSLGEYRFDLSRGVRLMKRADASVRMLMDADQVICGRNVTRRRINHTIRRALGRTSQLPQAGDRVICLRNDHDLGLHNGSQWRVLEAQSCDVTRTAVVTIESEDEDRTLTDLDIWTHHFWGGSDQLRAMPERRDFLEFDYGWAITVHKAQGSQWDSVVLLDESQTFGQNARRWLYTAVTRASEKICVVRR